VADKVISTSLLTHLCEPILPQGLAADHDFDASPRRAGAALLVHMPTPTSSRRVATCKWLIYNSSVTRTTQPVCCMAEVCALCPQVAGSSPGPAANSRFPRTRC